MGPNEIEYILLSKLYLLLARCARLNWQGVTVAASTPRGGRLGRSGRHPPPTIPVLLTRSWGLLLLRRTGLVLRAIDRPFEAQRYRITELPRCHR